MEIRIDIHLLNVGASDLTNVGRLVADLKRAGVNVQTETTSPTTRPERGRSEPRDLSDPAERQRVFDLLMEVPFKNPEPHRLLEVWRALRPVDEGAVTYDELWQRCGSPDRRRFAHANALLGKMFHLPQYYGQGLWLTPQRKTRIHGKLEWLFQANPHIHPDAEPGAASLRIA